MGLSLSSITILQPSSLMAPSIACTNRTPQLGSLPGSHQPHTPSSQKPEFSHDGHTAVLPRQSLLRPCGPRSQGRMHSCLCCFYLPHRVLVRQGGNPVSEKQPATIRKAAEVPLSVHKVPHGASVKLWLAVLHHAKCACLLLYDADCNISGRWSQGRQRTSQSPGSLRALQPRPPIPEWYRGPDQRWHPRPGSGLMLAAAALHSGFALHLCHTINRSTGHCIRP